jgi:hypothetical protein
MDNSEVDLFQMMKIVWEKKMQIFFYTVLIVVGAVIFAYIQPKNYEIHKTAFILNSVGKLHKSQGIFPPEYYAKLSRNPEILDAILKTLPREIKFSDNISSVDYLSSLLRVEFKKVSNVPNGRLGFQFTFFVRHTTPFSAMQISKAWQKVLEEIFSQSDKSVIFKRINEKRWNEMDAQIKSSQAKWDEVKKKLADFKNSYSISNKSMELASINRILEMAYYDSEDLVQRLDLATILNRKSEKIDNFKAKKLAIEEKYLVAQVALGELKMILKTQPRKIELAGKHEEGKTEFKYPQNYGVFNPVYIKLQEEVVEVEVLLKTLEAEKENLDKTILRLELELANKSYSGESSEVAQKREQIKMLANTIKRYDRKAHKLANQISKKNNEFKSLVLREVAFSKLTEKLKLLKNQNPKGLDFTASALEPTISLRPSMRTIVFLAFGCGLVFMILVTLIKASFAGQKEN